MSNHLNLIEIVNVWGLHFVHAMASNLFQQCSRLEEAEAGVIRVNVNAQLMIQRPPSLIVSDGFWQFATVTSRHWNTERETNINN